MAAYGIARSASGSMILKRAYDTVSRDMYAGRTTYTLDVRGSVAVDLVTGQHHQIRFLFVEHPLDELDGPGIGVALATVGSFGLSISAHAQTSTEMKIGNLHNLELAVLPDLGHGLLVLRRGASPYADAGVFAVLARVEVQGSVLDEFPARARFYCVCAKQHIDGRDCPLRIARVTLQRALDPDARGPGLPLLGGLRLFARRRVELADAHIHDDSIVGAELLLALALDVDVCLVDPAAAEVEVLLDAVPLLLVEHAFRERVERRACLHGEVGDDEAFAVQRQVVVHGLG
jgi:hypothetical protein